MNNQDEYKSIFPSNNETYNNIFPTNEQKTVEEVEQPLVNEPTIPVEAPTNKMVESTASVEELKEIATPHVILPEEKVENDIDPISTEFVDERGDKNDVIIESTNSYNPNMRKEVNYKLVESMKPVKNPLFRSRRLVHRGVFNSEIGIKNSGFAGIASLACITALAGLVVAYLILRF